MNKPTESVEVILDKSTILVKDECVIIDGVVFERLTEDGDVEYRFFVDVDDYDYVVKEVFDTEALFDKQMNLIIQAFKDKGG